MVKLWFTMLELLHGNDDEYYSSKRD